jgi:hypothetical protein
MKSSSFPARSNLHLALAAFQLRREHRRADNDTGLSGTQGEDSSTSQAPGSTVTQINSRQRLLSILDEALRIMDDEEDWFEPGCDEKRGKKNARDQ